MVTPDIRFVLIEKVEVESRFQGVKSSWVVKKLRKLFKTSLIVKSKIDMKL